MTIQWFPGHMAKAKREILEKLKLIDVVIELLDARIPISSRNPMINEIVQNKPRLVILNKSDLADAKVVEEWVEYFKAQALKAIPISSTSGKGINNLLKEAELLMAEKRANLKKKGIKAKAIRTLILGIPNVGKSSLINRLANRNIAKTGDRPGITKGQQWIKVGNILELLDTPGILWPKFEDPQVGYRLAATGAIKDDLLHFDDVALYIVKYLKSHYPDRLLARYNLEQLPEDNVETIEQIGKRRGALVSGGKIDFDKASEIIIRELRSGKLGPFCLEKPYL